MNPIILAIIIVTVIGLIGAVILVAASIFMYVPVDERITKITEALPGANCGACGCAGCADYAKTIVEEGNAVNKCVPGGANAAQAIASIMGVEAGASTPMKAVVACSGTCEKTSKKYSFQGIQSCQAVKGLYGGDGACAFGCLGYGDCTKACAFDAIHVTDQGVALVDRAKCTGCGACAKVCPNAIISIVPEHKRKPVVLCQNKDKGAQTRKICSAGCIGCMKCAKACPKEAITVENNLATIDQAKCVGCQLCVKECPVQVIHVPAQA
jgi:Na+-translocating ferredoxin:NAD+ oxidoreductase RNF subunit RnfB